jgi:hypothetical protein
MQDDPTQGNIVGDKERSHLRRGVSLWEQWVWTACCTLFYGPNEDMVPIEGSVCGCGPEGTMIERETFLQRWQSNEEWIVRECTDDNNGAIVGDIGNGAIHRSDYMESNGAAPHCTTKSLEGEPTKAKGGGKSVTWWGGGRWGDDDHGRWQAGHEWGSAFIWPPLMSCRLSVFFSSLNIGNYIDTAEQMCLTYVPSCLYHNYNKAKWKWWSTL